jgi:hypothetical protein
MKTVGIDARLYFQTGVGTYLRNLLFELTRLNLTGLRFIVYMLDSDADKAEKLQGPFTIRKTSSRWHTFGEQTELYRAIKNDSLDFDALYVFWLPRCI